MRKRQKHTPEKPITKKRDWRKPKDYESMNNLNLSQWAWEFLKRNQKYIELWKRFSNHLTEEQKRVQSWYYLSLNKGAFKAELCDATIWGLQYGYLNPDPNIEYRNIQFIPLGGKETIEFIEGGFEGIQVLGMPDYNTGMALFEFNFNQPISPQIELAKKKLLQLQKESKQKGNRTRKTFKPHTREWKTLIRILDAMAAGAKDKEIASVLFPNECPSGPNDPDKCLECPLDECAFDEADEAAGIKKVYDKKEQAKKYVNGDYRLIPHSEI